MVGERLEAMAMEKRVDRRDLQVFTQNPIWQETCGLGIGPSFCNAVGDQVDSFPFDSLNICRFQRNRPSTTELKIPLKHRLPYFPLKIPTS